MLPLVVHMCECSRRTADKTGYAAQQRMNVIPSTPGDQSPIHFVEGTKQRGRLNNETIARADLITRIQKRVDKWWILRGN